MTKRSLFVLYLFSLIVIACGQCPTTNYVYNATAANGNPLRGFMTYYEDPLPFNPDNYCPNSLLYSYIMVKDLMTGPNTFDWTQLEKILSDAKAINKQVIVRPYLDYPDTPPTGVPDFLTTNCGANCVKFTSYTSYGGGQSPDYTNTALITAMQQFIAALGAKYDGDNRLAFMEVGLLGFWGEWHTYPVDTLMAPAAVRKTVLDAYSNAFKKTFVLVSADQLGYGDTNNQVKNYAMIGWHDDDFGASTCKDATDGFKARLAATSSLDHAQTVSFGGEVQPDVQDSVMSSDSATTEFTNCVTSTRVSWLLYYNLFQSTFGAAKTLRALKAQESVGYQFTVTKVTVTNPTVCNQPTGVRCGIIEVTVGNYGNAPFYYDAHIQATIGDSKFTSTGNLKGLKQSPSASPQTVPFALPISWDATQNSVNVDIKIVSDYVYIPIKWAVSGVKSDGSITFNVPTGSCGIAGNGATDVTSNTNETSSNVTSDTNSTEDSDSSATYNFGFSVIVLVVIFIMHL